MFILFFFLMIRRPPRSTLDRSSAASDVYKRQVREAVGRDKTNGRLTPRRIAEAAVAVEDQRTARRAGRQDVGPVSYTHLRAHETVLDLVCRLLLEKQKKWASSRQYATRDRTNTSTL